MLGNGTTVKRQMRLLADIITNTMTERYRKTENTGQVTLRGVGGMNGNMAKDTERKDVCM